LCRRRALHHLRQAAAGGSLEVRREQQQLFVPLLFDERLAHLVKELLQQQKDVLGALSLLSGSSHFVRV